MTNNVTDFERDTCQESNRVGAGLIAPTPATPAASVQNDGGTHQVGLVGAGVAASLLIRPKAQP